ncbi:MAG: outer membrane beta-barrel domain-containing protein, partial [Bdellovibrionales bacterium]|nr:outer membrane beta-barrel domain-containing protein [Bdellovibrionales bacterium]
APKKRVNLSQDFDSLAENKDIVERAQALHTERKVQVVQNRLVDRNLRLELDLSYGPQGGGDSYIMTQNFGGQVNFHLTPRWSVGLRYYRAYNSLTAEGTQVYDNAQAIYNQYGTQYTVPQVDAPQDNGLFVVNWYPFYGKLALFDKGVAHFDVYALAGYGKMSLQSGVSDSIAGGGGVGLWWTQHFTSRIEVTYQSYRDLIGTLNRQQGAIQGIVSVGLML